MTTTKRDAVQAAMDVGKDLADGRIDAADLEQEVVETCRALFSTVVGENDPLFELQTEVARRVLAVGGIPANEQAEWLAVARNREQSPNTPPAPTSPPESI